MKIVDTHQHLWDLDLFRYSWLDSIPELNRSYRLTDYFAATEELDIVKTVHVEADVDESFMVSETRFVLQLSQNAENRVHGVVACGRPERKDFRADLDRIVGPRTLKGIRRVLHTQPDDLGYSDVFINNVSALANYGLSFDICVLSHQLPVAINLVARCPNVTFILDHCGIPPVKTGLIEPWRARIAEIAKFSNVFCKISGLVAYADPQGWTTDDLRPYVESVVGYFGWDRVLFGSDWPVCTRSATVAQWVRALQEITKSEDQANINKVFYGNAIRVYKLD